MFYNLICVNPEYLFLHCMVSNCNPNVIDYWQEFMQVKCKVYARTVQKYAQIDPFPALGHRKRHEMRPPWAQIGRFMLFQFSVLRRLRL